MHQHVTAFTAWRYRRGLPGAEATLRKVAEQGLVLLSTGGGDYTHPNGTAVKVDGGYRLSGRKRFASQAPVAGAVVDDVHPRRPRHGRRVLNVAVPMGTPGVTVVPTWDTLGMRGTASDDLVFDDVFVTDAQVLANRPHGVVDGPLQVISDIAFTIVSGAYLGVAEAAYQAARATASNRPDSALVQRQLGLMGHRLAVASWALDGALAAVGDDPTPGVRPHAGGDDREERGRPGRPRGLRPGHGGRRRVRVLQGLGRRAVLPRHPRRQVPPAHPRGHAARAGAACAGGAGGVPRVNPTDGRSLRRVLRHVPTSVTVVCTLDGNDPVGHTIGSFVSASLDPPLVGYFAMRSSATLWAVRRSGVFSVNVMGEHQVELARRFADRCDDPFDGVRWKPGPRGCPHLVAAVAVLDCEVDQVLTVGDHELVVGRVAAATVRAPGRGPLLFSGGRFRALSGSTPVQLPGPAAATPSWERAG